MYTSDASRFGAHLLSSPNVYMPVDKEAALERYSSGNAMIDSMFVSNQISNISTNLGGMSGLNQSRTLSLDIIANSVADNWKRPVYFATTVPTSYYLGLSPFLSATGMAYEVTPFKNPQHFNPTAEKAYRKIISEYRWGGLDQPGAENLYLDETVRRMVASLRSGIYTVVENLMAAGDLPASEASKEAARKVGLEEPQTQTDMARQLLDIIVTKLPGKVSPFDGMLGLYFARSYIDLFLETGDKADLDKAVAIIRPEAERYAQLVKYASTLDPVSRAQLGRSETYALQYLGEAVALENYTEILAAKPEIATDPQYEAQRALLRNIGMEADLRIAPIIFVEGYDAESLAKQLDSFPENQQYFIRTAIDILDLNKEAGIDPMAFSNSLMERHGFTAQQWRSILD